MVKRRDVDHVKYGWERRAQANLWRSIENGFRWHQNRGLSL